MTSLRNSLLISDMLINYYSACRCVNYSDVTSCPVDFSFSIYCPETNIWASDAPALLISKQVLTIRCAFTVSLSPGAFVFHFATGEPCTFTYVYFNYT